MKEAIGKYCGDFKPPSTPFQSSPFFGKYASGKGGISSDDDDTYDSTGPVTPVDPVPSPEEPEEDANGDGGGEEPSNGGQGDGGEEGFDPDAYEAPPQPSPETGTGTGGEAGPEGATQAPG
jgi:penicillin-binding protein 1A